MVALRKLGKTRYPRRDLFILNVARLDQLPQNLRFPGKYFACLLVCDARKMSDQDLQEFSECLLENGVVYFCVWGPDCERVHDLFDRVESAYHPSADEGAFVMTTWHERGTLEEAIWYFLNATFPVDKYVRTCRAGLAISVANEGWAQKVEKALKAPATFTRGGCQS